MEMQLIATEIWANLYKYVVLEVQSNPVSEPGT